ncbi:hypothetical protein GCM10011519_10240 [Marmoricola endophyticus]|uniref:Twin-arginine translocation signal domain-containing protein n=1 Tax=Marmoricola endophyticus TaxID=2040280 RepID=A0A917F2J9_9ACTN|nr:hypothetical protein [Marmoricola endophyticus]GGF38599.1 hypothetical protein GCM10011519_10240 [Marmoricola endophyticus]
MSQTSRRTVLAGAGVGVAGTAAVGLAGRADAAPAASTEAVVAWVENPRAGVVHVMSGEEEVVVTDHDLVARLLRAAGGK